MTATARFHVLSILPAVIGELLLFDLFLLSFWHAYDQEWSIELVQLPLAFAAMFFGMRFISRMLTWLGSTTQVTETAIVINSGWFGWRRERISLWQTTIRAEQGMIDRLLDRGNLYIETRSGEERHIGKLDNFRRIMLVLGL